VNWQAIGAIGEIAGALAVFASLVYLALQIRQNTRAIRGSAERETISLINNALQPIPQSLENSKLHSRGIFQFKELAPAEQVQFHHTISATFIAYESALYQHKAGLIGDEIYTRILNNLKGWFRFPGIVDWWEMWGDAYSDDFKELVDARIRPETEVVDWKSYQQQSE
jgi:hypothetical protein